MDAVVVDLASGSSDPKRTVRLDIANIIHNRGLDRIIVHVRDPSPDTDPLARVRTASVGVAGGEGLRDTTTKGYEWTVETAVDVVANGIGCQLGN